MWSDLRFRLRAVFRRRTVEAELDHELQFHREHQLRKYLNAGLSADEAARRVQLEFGTVDRIKEDCRDARGIAQWDVTLQDVRRALRGFRKRPGFASVAVFTLALGIGATTALFGLSNTVLLRPLPFPNPDRVTVLWEYDLQGRYERNTPAPANYVDWRAQNQTFDDIAAAFWQTFNLTGDGEPERVQGLRVTANFFSVLGVQPVVGRMMAASDHDSDGPVAVISYNLWSSHFAKDPSVAGRNVNLNGQPHTIIGVAPAGFQFPGKGADVWTAPGFSQRDLAARGAHFLFVVGRLKDGVALKQARADMTTIAARLAQQYPETNKDVGVKVVPAREYYAGDLRLALNVLLVAVGALLLIVCANLAHLFLARGAARRKEIAVCAALGAGRRRIIRELFTECLVLAGIAAVPGALLATAAFGFLGRLIPESFPDGTAVAFDWRVFSFTAAITLLTAILFSAGPALQTLGVNINDVLKLGTGRNLFRMAIGRFRGVLVATEVALTIILVVGAGLLLASYSRLRNVELGFQPDNVLTLETSLSPSKYADRAKRAEFYSRVIEGVSKIPGVASAAYVNFPPLTMKGGTTGFYIDGQPRPEIGKNAAGSSRIATSEYLRTIGVPLLRGRLYDERDGANAQLVVVINQTMVRKFWRGIEPLGSQIRFGDGGPEQPPYTVVGVVGDVRQMSLDEAPSPEMYLPVTQPNPGGSFFWPRTLVVRTTLNPVELAADLRRVVASVDPEQPVARIRTMNEILDVEMSGPQTQTTIISAFAICALLLAAIGLYGVLTYSVSQRTGEIGLRIALGARRGEVIGSIVGQAMRWAGAGAATGLAGALALTRMFSSLLFSVSPWDARTFLGATILLFAVIIAASFLPAYRASGVDPVSALKQG